MFGEPPLKPTRDRVVSHLSPLSLHSEKSGQIECLNNNEVFFATKLVSLLFSLREPKSGSQSMYRYKFACSHSDDE